jgi:hypothetical protein
MSSRPGIYQVSYTNDQYDLIGWAMYMREEHDWSALEIWRILEHFWRQQLGQTPFVSRNVQQWWMNRQRMKKRGVLWP